MQGCWPWAGLVVRGYGQIWWNRAGWKAHRVAWVLVSGPIPDGLYVCHRCDNPLCVNAAHLFIGTAADNIADRDAKGRAARLMGKDNPMSKLDELSVRLIREHLKAGRTGRDIATMFNVSPATICRVKSRALWGHI